MIGGGFAYKTCECEDFPCCGHNDVDPNWEPDPYDEYDRDDYDDPDEWDEDDDESAVPEDAAMESSLIGGGMGGDL